MFLRVFAAKAAPTPRRSFCVLWFVVAASAAAVAAVAADVAVALIYTVFLEFLVFWFNNK